MTDERQERRPSLSISLGSNHIKNKLHKETPAPTLKERASRLSLHYLKDKFRNNHEQNSSERRRPSRRERIKSSSIVAFVSRILPANRAEKGHTLRPELDNDNSKDSKKKKWYKKDDGSQKPKRSDPEEGMYFFREMYPAGKYAPEQEDEVEDGSAETVIRNSDYPDKDSDEAIMNLHTSEDLRQADGGSDDTTIKYNTIEPHHQRSVSQNTMIHNPTKKENIFEDLQERLLKEKQLRRERRRIYRASEDYLGVQGANPRTGLVDSSNATSSSNDPVQKINKWILTSARSIRSLSSSNGSIRNTKSVKSIKSIATSAGGYSTTSISGYSTDSSFDFDHMNEDEKQELTAKYMTEEELQEIKDISERYKKMKEKAKATLKRKRTLEKYRKKWQRGYSRVIGPHGHIRWSSMAKPSLSTIAGSPVKIYRKREEAMRQKEASGTRMKPEADGSLGQEAEDGIRQGKEGLQSEIRGRNEYKEGRVLRGAEAVKKQALGTKVLQVPRRTSSLHIHHHHTHHHHWQI